MYEDITLQEVYVDSSLTDTGVSFLYHMSDFVINRHFSWYYDRDDLRQSGFVKGYEMLCDGAYEPSRASLRNYIYTCIRNTLQTIIYHHSKWNGVDIDTPDMVDEFTYTGSDFNVIDFDISSIEFITTWYSCDTLSVVSWYLYTWFNIDIKVDRLEGIYSEEVESLVCLILWRVVDFL